MIKVRRYIRLWFADSIAQNPVILKYFELPHEVPDLIVGQSFSLVRCDMPGIDISIKKREDRYNYVGGVYQVIYTTEMAIVLSSDISPLRKWMDELPELPDSNA